METIGILNCEHFILNDESRSLVRLVRDYEFDYYPKGNREMYLDNVQYHISGGSFVFRKPGQKVYSCGSYNCYILTLDFSGRPILEAYDRNTGNDTHPPYSSCIFEYIPVVFKPNHGYDYERIFKKLYLFSYPVSSHDPQALDLVLELLHLLVADSIANRNRNSQHNKTIEEICLYIRNHYSENLTLDTLANAANFNKHYFARLFKKEIGISPANYLIQIRLENAKHMLFETNLSIKQIALNCGYREPSFFNYYFKKQFNITPFEYRNSNLLKKKNE